MKKIELVVSGLYAPQRLDVYLARVLEGQTTRSQLKTFLEQGKILLNGAVAKPRVMVKTGDRIEGLLPQTALQKIEPQDLPLKIIFQDDAFMVIDKPAGMVVHPGPGNKKDTLVNAILFQPGSFSDVGGASRPGIVHRLDKDTSGLLLIAKTNPAHRRLQQQFMERSLEKKYLAIVKGQVEYEQGHIDEPIGRHPKIRERMAVSHKEDAREAHTNYQVLKRFRYATLVEVSILTGRTHQIRVHFAHLGHPVLGDELYGTKGAFARQALHAWTIEIDHPVTGERLKFESPMPDDFKKMLEEVEQAG